MGCTSNGKLCVWDVRESFRGDGRQRNQKVIVKDDEDGEDEEGGGRKRSLDQVDACCSDGVGGLGSKPLLW